MRRKRSLRENTAWATLGAVSQALYQFGVMFLLAEFGSTVLVGRYAVALAISAPLSIFADRALRTIQATDNRAGLGLSDYLGFRLGIACVTALVTAAILMVSRYSLPTSQVIVLVTLHRCVESVAQVLYGQMHAHEQMQLIGRSQALRFGMALLVVALVISQTGRLELALVAALIPNLVIIGMHDGSCAVRLVDSAPSRTVNVRFHCVPWKHLLALTLPLGAGTFMISLNASLPRYLLATISGEETLGIFAVLCYFCFPALTVVSALTQAAVPRLARLHREQQPVELQRLVVKLSVAVLLIALGNALFVIVFGQTMLHRLFDSQYASAAPLLRWIVVAAGLGFVAGVPATTLTAQRRFASVLWVCTLSSSACILSAVFLIPRFGLVGAAWVLVITSLVHLLASVIAHLRGSFMGLSTVWRGAATGAPI